VQLSANVSAVVMGGASGLGEATVRALRARQVRVAILDLNRERGSAVAAETGALFFAANVLDEASMVSAFDAARSAQGQERVLVTTPGGGGLGHTAWRDASQGRIRRHDFQRFGQIVALNLNGTFLCASIAAAGMMTLTNGADGDRGVIVMTSSTASQDAPPATVAYVAAKAAINGMTLAMARDLVPEAIRVDTILPGTLKMLISPVRCRKTHGARSTDSLTCPYRLSLRSTARRWAGAQRSLRFATSC
jgi:NAD(P)-dependent dehydrogenase (short-subunit alcohol dehydrogenase family)